MKLKKKKGKDLIIIEVEHTYAPISYHGRFNIKSGSTIQELKGNESRFLISKSGKNWDEYVEENTSIEDLNM